MSVQKSIDRSVEVLRRELIVRALDDFHRDGDRYRLVRALANLGVWTVLS
jgi:hypothetical protein